MNRTEWHRIVVWGPLAEFCEKYLTQGKQILLEGKLRTRQWQDKDGNKRIDDRGRGPEHRPPRTAGGVGPRGGPSAEGPSGPDFPMEGDETAHAGGGGGGDDDIPF